MLAESLFICIANEAEAIKVFMNQFITSRKTCHWWFSNINAKLIQNINRFTIVQGVFEISTQGKKEKAFILINYFSRMLKFYMNFYLTSSI